MNATDRSPWGLLAEFKDLDTLVEAVRKTRESKFRQIDAFCSYPSEELSEALALNRGKVPGIFLAGGIIGGLSAYGMQYYAAVIAYPWNAGGKPYHSWPMFIPITFELTILGAAIFGVIGLFMLCGFPRLYHPLFNSERFERASIDGYFLAIESSDPEFDLEKTRQFLTDLGAVEVEEVDP
ncbi:MAG: DUF3341 domain-containing protein [Candidatus Omnitrophica bacterium]|nr:DUF3341 domain-containing protein [Candidatus Omnitrophota bacterium]